MRIIDSQVHIWAADRPDRPWPAWNPDLPKAHQPEPLTAELLLQQMDAAGVDGAILISPVFEGCRNDVVLAAAEQHRGRFAVMGRFEPEASDSRSFIPAARGRGMAGVRFTFHRPHQRPLLVEHTMDWMWDDAEKHDLPVMLLALHADLPLIGRIAHEHSGLRLILDHLCLTEGTGEQAFRGLPEVLALARHPNVAVKVSCLPHYTGDPYPYRSLEPYLKQVYAAFGPRRMFWGSDLSRLRGTYRQCVTMFTEEQPWLSTADLTWIMGRGLSEWLKLEPPLADPG
jgi:predicted TIM-barrel fold metal-dependent hydrolase